MKIEKKKMPATDFPWHFNRLNNDYIAIGWRKLDPEYGIQLHNFLHGGGKHLSMALINFLAYLTSMR